MRVKKWGFRERKVWINCGKERQRRYTRAEWDLLRMAQNKDGALDVWSRMNFSRDKRFQDEEGGGRGEKREK